MKARLRDLLASALYLSGLTPARNIERLVIATFHRVLPERELAEYPLPQIAITPEELAWFLAAFAENFELGPLDRLHQRWRRGGPPSRPLLAVTFDDAQRDNFRHARPVLDAAGVRATFFAPTQAVESGGLLWHDRAAYAASGLLRDDRAQSKPLAREFGLPAQTPESQLPALIVERLKARSAADREQWIAQKVATLRAPSIPTWDGMMSFDELRRLAGAGHEIGSHSHTHPILTNVDDATLDSELLESASILERELGQCPTSFCYPNGDADERVFRALRSSPYQRAVTTRPGSNPKGHDAFQLLRFDIQSRTARSAQGMLSPGRVALRMSRRSLGSF